MEEKECQHLWEYKWYGVFRRCTRPGCNERQFEQYGSWSRYYGVQCGIGDLHHLSGYYTQDGKPHKPRKDPALPGFKEFLEGHGHRYYSKDGKTYQGAEALAAYAAENHFKVAAKALLE